MKNFLKFLLVFFGIPLAAFSQITQYIEPPEDQILTIANVSIPRDKIPYGSVIASVEGSGKMVYSNLKGCRQVQTSTIVGGTLVSGYTNVYQTNIPGVGIRFSHTRGLAGRYVVAPQSTPFHLVASWSPAGNTTQKRKIELIAVGEVSSGTLTEAPYMRVHFRGPCIRNQYDTTRVRFSRTNFSTYTCTVGTTQVNVKLPDVKVKDFSGVNSTVGATNFSIGLQCPQKTAVYITLTDKTNLSNRTGILSLVNNAGRASGVGLQILKSGTVVKFGPDSAQKGTENQILGADSTGSISIPFRVRYIATAGTVTAGVVNASATFTMSYQ